jgi:hypothetical protein
MGAATSSVKSDQAHLFAYSVTKDIHELRRNQETVEAEENGE